MIGMATLFSSIHQSRRRDYVVSPLVCHLPFRKFLGYVSFRVQNGHFRFYCQQSQGTRGFHSLSV